MVQGLFLNRVDAEPGRAPVGGQNDLVILSGTHKTKSSLAVVELAVAWTEVALDATVLETVPITGRCGVERRLGRDAHDLYLCEGAQVSNPVPARAQPRTRPPAVAGRFYDADRDRLSAEVRRLLAKAGQAPTTSRPEAIIVPHAGYAYSGEVAATAFNVLEPLAGSIRRVVLIGPAHYVPFSGIAIPTSSAFETPLGPVSLDLEALRELSAAAKVRTADEPHAPEHALEVEVPFLQRVLPRFTLVPLLVGDASPSDVADVLGLLCDGPETVVVVSSDLSHFHEYETPRRADGRDDRSWLVEKSRAGRGLWASGHSRPSPAGRATTPQSDAALPAKLRRHGGPSRLSRGLRGMAVR